MNSEIELPVQKQLEAYNARDIDAFMLWWADDCQYYAFPATLLAGSAAEIRERHIERFKEPDLHGKLLTRIVVGNVVIDHGVVIPEGLIVGEDPELDARRFRRTENGICLITQSMIDKLDL